MLQCMNRILLAWIMHRIENYFHIYFLNRRKNHFVMYLFETKIEKKYNFVKYLFVTHVLHSIQDKKYE